MLNIKYSIIIPHYNMPQLLQRCLDSIPERDDIQVIIADDNSPGSEDYQQLYPALFKKKVEFIFSKSQSKGGGGMRNIGIDRAKGEWLIFADSDDFFVEDFETIIDEHYNDTEDVLFFNVKGCLDEDVNTLNSYNHDRFFNLYNRTKDDRYFRIGYTQPWGKMYRRKFIIENEIRYAEISVSNDYLFAVKSGFLARSIKVINQQLYWYVERKVSVSHGNISPKKLDIRLQAYIEVQKFLDSQNIRLEYSILTELIARNIRKNALLYVHQIRLIKKNDYSANRVIKETLKYYFNKVLGRNPNLCLTTPTFVD